MIDFVFWHKLNRPHTLDTLYMECQILGSWCTHIIHFDSEAEAIDWFDVVGALDKGEYRLTERTINHREINPKSTHTLEPEESYVERIEREEAERIRGL